MTEAQLDELHHRHVGEHREGGREDESGGGDDAAGGAQRGERGLRGFGAVQGLLAHAVHEEDAVVDAQCHQEDEGQQAQARVGALEAEEGPEDESADA